MGGIDVGADHCDLMVIAGVGQAGVTAPTIRVDGASGLHGGAHKGQQAVSRHIPNAAQPDPAEAATVLLDGDRDNGLARGLPASCALFRCTDIGFVHLNLAMKVVPARADHRPPQLVQPGPGRPVAAKAKDALEAQGADTILLARDKPHRQEPLPQRFMSVLEDCAGRQRNLPTAGSTAQQAARHLCRFACHPAVWADEPVRPAKPADIRSAGRFRAEPRLELAEGPRVISSGLWRACIDHAPILSIAAGCVKCIPTFAQIDNNVRSSAPTALEHSQTRAGSELDALDYKRANQSAVPPFATKVEESVSGAREGMR